MFLKIYFFLTSFLVLGITSSYGLNVKKRKEIYVQYVSLNKFEGEWIDPHSLGIFDGDLVSEELQDSMHSEYSNKEEIQGSPESFSGHRIFPLNKLLDDLGSIFVSESNTLFSLVRNLMTIAAIVTFMAYILFVLSSKMLIWFGLILSLLWNWMKLYQEKIAEKQNLTENLHHPNECHRGDLYWYEFIYLYFLSYMSSPTDCKEYYKAQLVDPFWEVSLPVAIMNTFTSSICEPMKVFATAVRFCFAVLFSGLTMLQLSVTLFSIFIFLLMWFRYSFIFCWGAISLFQQQSSADQTTSLSLSGWRSVIKSLKSLLFRESALIHPSELSISPESKKVCSCNKYKIKVSEKPDEFQNEKGTNNAWSKNIVQSAFLHSEKNKDNIKVSEKPDESLKEKGSDNVQSKSILQSASLHSEKNKDNINVSEKPDGSLKEKGSDNVVQSKSILQSTSLHSEKNKDNIKVSEKPDGSLKEKGSDNVVQSKSILQSASLHSEKNDLSMVSLKSAKFRKCHKKSFSASRKLCIKFSFRNLNFNQVHQNNNSKT